MRGRVRWLVVVVAVISLSGCVWPSFRFGPDRAGYNPLETTLGVANIARLTPAWSVNTGTLPVGDPVVGGNRVIVAAGRRLLAFDPSGTQVWSVDYGTTSGGTAFAAADPTIADTTVWAGSGGTASGSVVGSVDEYDLATGATKYATSVAADTGSAAVSGQYVYFPFIAGAYQAWGAISQQSPSNGFISTSGIVGVPTVGGGQVFAQGQGGILEGGFDASGATCPVNPHTNGKICSPGWTVTIGSSMSTIAYTSSALYVGADDDELHAFSPTGSPLWVGVTNGGVISSPAVAKGVVYVGSGDGKLYAFNASGCGQTTCAPLWSMATGATILSSPAVANGVVYVGSLDGRLYAANAAGCGKATCTPLWTSAQGAAIHSSPAVADGSVFIGRDDGTLTAYHLSN
jgi:outer membrane protein assembly factor BamB